MSFLLRVEAPNVFVLLVPTVGLILYGLLVFLHSFLAHVDLLKFFKAAQILEPDELLRYRLSVKFEPHGGSPEPLVDGPDRVGDVGTQDVPFGRYFVVPERDYAEEVER